MLAFVGLSERRKTCLRERKVETKALNVAIKNHRKRLTLAYDFDGNYHILHEPDMRMVPAFENLLYHFLPGEAFLFLIKNARDRLGNGISYNPIIEKLIQEGEIK